MNKNLLGKLLALVALTLTMSVSGLRAVEIKVFGAASLTDVLKELAPAYEKKSGDTLVFSMGASSAVARQIQEGAPADVFFSADEAKMDTLAKDGLIVKDTRVSLLSNALVVVVPADSTLTVKSLSDLTGGGIKKLALAEPNTVPVGVYTKKYLEQAGLWGKVESKVIPTQNVRASLAAVEGGNVDAGIVYKTDAAISKKVRLIYEFPADGGDKISYPVAVVNCGEAQLAARKYVAWLQTPEALAVFKKFGFVTLK
jgi:molybdate transport system substrate-binding protein